MPLQMPVAPNAISLAGRDAARPVEGIDAVRVTDWFEAFVEDVVPPLEFALVAGGRSNLTYRVSDAAGNTWALRRPPVSHVLPTAHDMAREHRVMSSLGPTDVPVPITVRALPGPLRKRCSVLRDGVRRGFHPSRRGAPWRSASA